MGTTTFYEWLNDHKPKVALAAKNLPLLVRYRDINDLTTIERVNPDDLEASFGRGVRIVGTTLEITDDPVTNVAKDKLPCIYPPPFSAD